jgi:TRAP-type C4-dicarboxylate transport system permease small subunit
MSTALPAQPSSAPSPSGVRAVLSAADRALAAALKWITIAVFMALLLILTANIAIRFFPDVGLPAVSLHWFDEIVELLYAALIFYGSAAVWMNKGHFSVGDWISRRIPSERGRRLYRLLLEIGCLAFAAVFFRYSLQLTMRAEELTPVFGISKKVHYSCMPISAAVMVIYSVKNALVEFVGTVTGSPKQQP